MSKPWVKELISWVRSFAIAFVIAILINAFVLQTYRVEGQSMQPGIDDHDFALINKLSQSYDYGDIVVIDSRIDRKRSLTDNFKENGLFSTLAGKHDENMWIKRVIGRAGDRLEFRNNELFRNGKKLSESYIKEQMQNNADQVIVVPKEHIFVMGDNRNNSNDSRFIGPIPKSHVIGKVVFNK